MQILSRIDIMEQIEKDTGETFSVGYTLQEKNKAKYWESPKYVELEELLPILYKLVGLIERINLSNPHAKEWLKSELDNQLHLIHTQVMYDRKERVDTDELFKN